MKTPICTFDAKTGVLCNMCENKVQNGVITQADVNSSIILSKVAQKNKEIDKMTLIGSREIDSEMVLIFKGSDVRTIRSNKNILDTIQKAFNKNIWIIESDSNDRRFLENLFYPSKIENINFIWLPDGNKLTRVIIDKKSKKIDDKYLKLITQISKEIKNIELIIEEE